MSSNIFETATRAKTKFQTPKGQMDVIDLWDLSLVDLDKTFRSLNKTIKTATEESLLEITSDADTEAKFQISVIRHIVEVKQAENKKKAAAAEKKAEREKILAALASAEARELLAASTEDLRARLAALDD